MFIVIWEYSVKPENQTEFEAAYGSNGEWTRLFKMNKGYLGTEFLRNEEHPSIFITIDRWQTHEDYKTFYRVHEEKYKLLDAKFENLTESESLLGKWSTVQPSSDELQNSSVII